MEEPWDELMGPSPQALKNMLHKEEERKPSGQPLRGSSSSAPPPSAVFSHITASRTNAVRDGLQASASAVLPAVASPQPPRQSRGRSSLAFEDEGTEDHSRIREEAKKVLEVADDQSYSVRRTTSGGFSATASTSNNGGKRVRSALSGLSYAAKRVTNPTYRDDPYVETEEASVTTISREDFEYGDQGVVDVVGMERRSMSTRPSEARSSSSWSSRYSVDNTLLNMSGGAASQRRVLDSMDRNHDRQTSRNLFGGKSSPNVFGANGFSFRKKHVFGKQNVSVKPPSNNLQTVWMDMEASSLPPANNRSKSWQEQLQQKRAQRRRYILVVLLAFAFTVALASLLGTGQHKKLMKSEVTNAMAPGSVTFYVTADGPNTAQSEEKLETDLHNISPQASALFHVGNLQDASVTSCESSVYKDVANILKESPVPTFVVPGQEDINNCPDPEAARKAWRQEFIFFHRNFLPHQLNVMEQKDQLENFAVVHQGVLFLGLHLVGGNLHDRPELDRRNELNYEWVYGNLEQYEDDIRAVVILANAHPGEINNRDFFISIGEFLGSYSKPIAYVHASSELEGATEIYQPFKGVNHIMGVRVGGDEGSKDLVRMNVGFGDKPFIVG